MFRKTLFALAATAAVAGAMSLAAPTTASAGWKHHHWHHGWHHRPHFGVRFHGPRYLYGGCFRVKKVVMTKYGPRVRRIWICD